MKRASTTPPAGGVCDRACDPLADNDFDGSGTASDSVRVRTGRNFGLVCGTNIAMEMAAGRKLYWCPNCQR